MKFQSSFNMPPGCYITDIPGWNTPPDHMWPDVRCKCCGCFICYSASFYYPPSPSTTEAMTETVTHYDTYTCPGAKAFSGEDVGLCGDACGDEPHTWEEYAGSTIYYRCKHCGAETGVSEF